MIELETIDGIGPKTKELLNKIKIYDRSDLLNYYPYQIYKKYIYLRR